MNNRDIENFVRERDEAFIAFVRTDDFRPVARYLRKYRMAHGEDLDHPRDVLKAGVYKAARHCTNIPDDVKQMAETKCRQLGFSPEMDR